VFHHHFAVAAHLFGAADALRELIGGSPHSHSSSEEGRAAVRAELGEAAFAEAWQSGHTLSVEEAVASLLALPTLSAPVANPSDLRPFPSITYPAGLTPREVEVLRLLAHGLTYAQIAERLIISPHTVNRHLTAIYTKLNVTSRHAATRLALDHHLV
jgi:DNA-binding CsgD family transcriptional regulator